MARPGLPLNTLLPARGSSGPPDNMSGVIDELFSEQRTVLDGSNNLQTWTGKKELLVLTAEAAGFGAANRPLLTVIPGLFGGHKVVKFDRTPRTCATPTLSSIIPNGAHTWQGFVMAILDYASPPSYTLFGHGFPQTWYWQWRNTLYSSITYDNVAQTQSVSCAMPNVLAPLFCEQYYTAAGYQEIAINRVVRVTGTTVCSSPQGAQRLIMGLNGGYDTVAAYGFLRLCSSLPSDAQRDALYAWAKSYYAIP